MDRDGIRVAVISDTHGLLRRGVVREVRDCAFILHAGDIIHESDLDELATIPAISREIPSGLRPIQEAQTMARPRKSAKSCMWNC